VLEPARYHGLAVVTRAAQRQKPHQRRGALPVVVADVDAEAHLRPAAALEGGVLCPPSPLLLRAAQGTAAFQIVLVDQTVAAVL